MEEILKRRELEAQSEEDTLIVPAAMVKEETE
jgi:hypothetical protein